MGTDVEGAIRLLQLTSSWVNCRGICPTNNLLPWSPILLNLPQDNEIFQVPLFEVKTHCSVANSSSSLKLVELKCLQIRPSN